MKNAFLPFLLSVFFVTIQSCGSDNTPNDDTDSTITYNDKELALHNADKKNWQFTDVTINNKSIFPGLKECEKDNVYIFDIYENHSVDAGPLVCTINPEPDVNRGFYEFKSGFDSLYMNLKDTVFTAKILTLTKDELVWEQTVENSVFVKKLAPL